MNKFRMWLSRVLTGRYGSDELGRFLSMLALILCVVSIFTTPFVYIASILLMIVVYLRVFSKNIAARRRENDRYRRIVGKLFRRDPNYKIFKCPKCRQKLRLPRHRGKIEIRCRKCGNQFVRRT